jgi:single-stranded-DNA-specific exonuclease
MGSMTTVPPLIRRWRTDGASAAPEAVARLVSELRLPEPLCRLLVARGHDDPDAARAFLRPSLSDLHEPRGLPGLDAAVARIGLALDRRETILVHGDYDVDGICAAALYTRVLRRLGATVVPFVPHRVRDGYDLGQAGLRRAAEADASLIVTADCGVVAHDAISAAAAAGIDVVVTDHHVPAATLPPAVAVVNPKRPDSGYPNPGLAGAGVAYKVALALARARGLPDDEVHYSLDLVALATVADVMPLTGENRVMTRYGLRVLRESRSPGIRALLAVAGLEGKPLTAGHLSHGLGPRLNAVGRLEDADTGLRLLLADADGAVPLAAELEAANARRQAVDRQILDEAVSLLDGRYDGSRDRAIVLAREGWHPGVIGIVASRLVERFHRPTVLIARPADDGVARGSARSIPGFDLLAAVRACGAHLERYGGHAAAAGFDIRAEAIDAFRAAFQGYAGAALPDPPVPELRIDLELTLDEVTPELVRFLSYAGPFGVGNPTPVFALRRVSVDQASPVGRDRQHLRLRLRQGDQVLPAIAFRLAPTHGGLARPGTLVDVAAQLQEDDWRGRSRIQARVVDLRPAD